MLAVYAIVNGNDKGWTSGQTLGLLGAAVALMAVFLAIESRVASPLMPLALFRLRNVATANVVGILWSAAMFAWFFLSALYLQLVLGYSPLKVGLAFLPANLIMGAFSVGLSAKLVMRFGIRPPLAVGLLLAAAGLVLFARAPVHGSFVVDVLPSMILLGFGAGMAFNPLLLGAMSDVEPSESGLASGVVNTAFMMGGALGLAVLASIAASRSDSLTASGDGKLAALVGGYHLAFLVGAIFATAAAVVGAVFFRAAVAQSGRARSAVRARSRLGASVETGAAHRACAGRASSDARRGRRRAAAQAGARPPAARASRSTPASRRRAPRRRLRGRASRSGRSRRRCARPSRSLASTVSSSRTSFEGFTRAPFTCTRPPSTASVARLRVL